jgi:hypothetical protein
MTSAALSFTEQNYREVALQRGPHQKLGSFTKSASLHRFQPSGSPSPVANHNGAGSEEMSSVSNRINLPSHSVPSITDDELAERVKFALQAWGKSKPAPIKQIEHIADVDQKTASAWFNGKNPPRPGHLFTLALKIPELKAEIARLLRLEQDQAESFQREAIALLQRWAR